MRGREEFALWLANQLDERNYSNNAFAKRIGVAQSSVSYWTTGHVIPNPDNCRRIADALGVPRDEVLRRAGWLSPQYAADLDITADELQALNLFRKAKGKAPVTYWPAQEKSADDLIAEIHTTRPNLDLSFLDGARGRISEELIQLLLQNMLAIISGSEEETRAFIELHRKASMAVGFRRVEKSFWQRFDQLPDSARQEFVEIAETLYELELEKKRELEEHQAK
jgi:transcriptional regulator with XRE-family HTH domain